MWFDKNRDEAWWSDEPSHTHCKYQRVTLGSGASISAFPPAMAPGFLVTADDRTGTEYATA
eukprot:15233955-Heterocapsa_arctica.AAC.1